MAKIVLRLVEGETAVELELDGVTSGARSELEYALMLAGGVAAGRGYRVPAFAFRRASPEIAGLVHRADARVEIQAGVERILRTQLQEIQARRAAEAGIESMPPDAVISAIRATGRFVRPLTDRQVANLGRLLPLQHGANFSVPGAGKTTTLLALHEALRGSGIADRLLVVAPKNAFLSWEQETAECFGEAEDAPRVTRLTAGRAGVAAALMNDPEIALITYQLLPNVADVVKGWARRHGTHVALDESHRAKAGYSGVYASAALQLAEVAVRRDILSGTPLPHAPEDLRPQLDFLWPGQRVLPDFRLLSESPPEVIEDVEQRVRPLYVRTTKEQLQLPELILRPIAVTLGPLQRELYELLRSEAARAAAGISSRDRRFLRSVGRHVVRLIEAATNPMLLTHSGLVDPSSPDAIPQGTRAWELLRELARSEQPAKVARAVALAEERIAQGERALIWSGFVMNIMALERLLEAHNPVVLFGQVPTGEADDPDTREGRIRRFHDDPACRVMIANPAAAGEGISLHRACHYAVYLDRNFNAAHFLQSVDRIHRLGSDRPSRVDVLEARGTIDSRIAERLRAKIGAMAQILNDEGLKALAYDPEDVVDEFEGGIELEDIERIVDHLSSEDGED